MIDSVKLAWLLTEIPSREILAEMGWSERFNQYTGQLSGWTLKDREELGEPRLQIFRAPDGKPYLTVLVSLPRFIKGTNATLLSATEVDDALKSLSFYVSAKFGQQLPIEAALVWELHYAEDLQFREEEVSHVISLICQLQINGFKRGGYSETTVYFQSGRKKKSGAHPRGICFYAKQRERIDKGYLSDAEITAGIVRIEYRFRTTSAIKQFVKTNRLSDRGTVSLINPRVVTKVLGPIIRQVMRLLETAAKRDVIGILRSHYSPRRIATLLAHLVYLEQYGPHFYRIQALGYQRSKYFDCQRACRAAGIYALYEQPSRERSIQSNNCIHVS